MAVLLLWALLMQVVRFARGTGLPPSALNQQLGGWSSGSHTTLAHWGMEFDGLDFFETLIPGPCPLPSH